MHWRKWFHVADNSRQLENPSGGNISSALKDLIEFAVSQSGEAEPVINDVRHARKNGY